jgi:hypothetical protein
MKPLRLGITDRTTPELHAIIRPFLGSPAQQALTHGLQFVCQMLLED